MGFFKKLFAKFKKGQESIVTEVTPDKRDVRSDASTGDWELVSHEDANAAAEEEAAATALEKAQANPFATVGGAADSDPDDEKVTDADWEQALQKLAERRREETQKRDKQAQNATTTTTTAEKSSPKTVVADIQRENRERFAASEEAARQRRQAEKKEAKKEQTTEQTKTKPAPEESEELKDAREDLESAQENLAHFNEFSEWRKQSLPNMGKYDELMSMLTGVVEEDDKLLAAKKQKLVELVEIFQGEFDEVKAKAAAAETSMRTEDKKEAVLESDDEAKATTQDEANTQAAETGEATVSPQAEATEVGPIGSEEWIKSEEQRLEEFHNKRKGLSTNDERSSTHKEASSTVQEHKKAREEQGKEQHEGAAAGEEQQADAAPEPKTP